jgi:hypothetical protein
MFRWERSPHWQSSCIALHCDNVATTALQFEQPSMGQRAGVLPGVLDAYWLATLGRDRH